MWGSISGSWDHDLHRRQTLLGWSPRCPHWTRLLIRSRLSLCLVCCGLARSDTPLHLLPPPVQVDTLCLVFPRLHFSWLLYASPYSVNLRGCTGARSTVTAHVWLGVHGGESHVLAVHVPCLYRTWLVLTQSVVTSYRDLITPKPVCSPRHPTLHCWSLGFLLSWWFCGSAVAFFCTDRPGTA